MAVAVKRRKKLTNREKELRKAVKKDMQAEGTLPPDKKRLNRKKFAEEVMNSYFNSDFSVFNNWHAMTTAISFMLPGYHEGKVHGAVTPEDVGVLKVLKVAMDISAFYARKGAEGYTSASIQEIYEDVVKPIANL